RGNRNIGAHDQPEAKPNARPLTPVHAGEFRDRLIERADVAECIEWRAAFRLTSVTADREIGASAGKCHDVGFFRRPADDLAELTDHCFGEGIPCRDTLDHDRANAILDVVIDNAVLLGLIRAGRLGSRLNLAIAW